MDGKTKGKFIGAIAALVLFSGVSIGTSFALFSSEKTITNHFTIGKGLMAGLYLSELKQDVIDDETGNIKENNYDLTKFKTDDGKSAYDDDKKAVDLSKYQEDIFQENLLAPTMTGEATLRLYNLGELAFSYKVETTKTAYDKDGKKDDDAEILDQIVFVFDYTETVVSKGSYAELKVSYEFKDRDDNNLAVEQSIAIDLRITTTQVTK